jgi:hypothetical protein
MNFEELAEQAETEDKIDVLQNLIDEHRGCLTDTPCALCAELEEQRFESLLFYFAENPNLTTSQQDDLLDAAQDSESLNRLIDAFVERENISDETKAYVLEYEGWTALRNTHGGDDDENIEYLESLVSRMKANSRFSASEISTFIQEVEDEMIMPKGWAD